jgi:hypothetical protein
MKACLYFIKVKDNFLDWASKRDSREACLYEIYGHWDNTQVPIMEPSPSKW